MRASILSIGSEILRGDIVDTNAAFLARELSALGFDVRRVEGVGDDLSDLASVVERAMHRADVTVCTGGLGPTEDDLTRQAIAAALKETLYIDTELVKEIETRFAAMKRSMPRSNDQQAMLIPSAKAIPNPNGTAPGWYAARNGTVIVAMPGPPHEMEPMWRDSVAPRLEQLVAGAIARRALMTFGIGESMLERRITDVIHWRPDVTVATYAKSNGVQIHVTVTADTQQIAETLADEAEHRLREIVGESVFGVGDDTLSGVIGTLLSHRGYSISVMESCTGGSLASMITDTSGSSVYFMGGIVAYTREAKCSYGVPAAVMDEYGLISAETASSMARAVRERMNTRVGLGVTGVAGAEPVEGKPPGTCFVAVSVDAGPNEVREIHRPGQRHVIKRYFAQCALDLLRRQLQITESKTI